MPAGWAEIDYLGVRWEMPAGPLVKEGTSGGARHFGHNALKPDGSLDRLATYNVSIFKPTDPPTTEPLRANLRKVLADAVKQGFGSDVTEFVPLSPPLIGEQAHFYDTRYSMAEVFVRWMLFGDVVVFAFSGGDVGSDRDYFFESFSPSPPAG